MRSFIISEFRYNRNALMIGGTICTLLLLVQILTGSDNAYSLMSTAMISYFITIGIIGSESDKEKRDRFMMLLSIDLKTAALTRLIFLVVVLLGFNALWLVFATFVTGPLTGVFVWRVISTMSLVLGLICLFVIHADLGHMRTKKYRFLMWTLLFLSAISHVLLFLLGSDNQYLAFWRDVVSSPLGALALVVSAGLLLYLDMLVFKKRVFYLQ